MAAVVVVVVVVEVEEVVEVVVVRQGSVGGVFVSLAL